MPDKNADESKPSLEVPPAGNQTSTGKVASNEIHRLLHQLNQPLTAISNYARAGIQLIDYGMADTARMKELFEKIATQTSRTTTLSQDLGAAVTKLAQEEEQK